MPGTVPQTGPPQTMAPGAPQPQPQMEEVPLMTSVLQLPHEYMMMLYEEDMKQIQADTGCEVQILESEEGATVGGWTVTLFGDDVTRDTAHRYIEDLLNQRMNEMNQQGDAGAAPQGMEQDAQMQDPQYQQGPDTSGQVPQTGEGAEMV